MERQSGKYALVQFCPVPERLEFLNIGVVLLIPELRYVGVRVSKGQSRIERMFGKQPKAYVDAVKEGFASRLKLELARSMDSDFIAEFSRRRANSVRLSPLMPIMVANPDAELDRLFAELVGDDEPLSREPRIRRKLRDAFARSGVTHYLDDPEPVELPEYGVKINVPFGYQNGCYNLVDGMRLSPNVGDSLREAGKRAMEGGLVWKHFQDMDVQKRLVVVGDFSNQSNEFYHAVSEQMEGAHVKLHRLDDLRPLLNDIKQNAALHH
jgi:hypothetical protein